MASNRLLCFTITNIVHCAETLKRVKVLASSLAPGYVGQTTRCATIFPRPTTVSVYRHPDLANLYMGRLL
jgi:hypothetical protein